MAVPVWSKKMGLSSLRHLDAWIGAIRRSRDSKSMSARQKLAKIERSPDAKSKPVLPLGLATVL
jgi:hypothetical protein